MLELHGQALDTINPAVLLHDPAELLKKCVSSDEAWDKKKCELLANALTAALERPVASIHRRGNMFFKTVQTWFVAKASQTSVGVTKGTVCAPQKELESTLVRLYRVRKKFQKICAWYASETLLVWPRDEILLMAATLHLYKCKEFIRTKDFINNNQADDKPWMALQYHPK